MTQPKDAKRLTSGQVGPKCRVWGGSPTSIFSGPPGPEKKQVSIHLPCLPFSETPNLHEKRRPRFSHTSSASLVSLTVRIRFSTRCRSFASMELSMTLIRFLQASSAPMFR